MNISVNGEDYLEEYPHQEQYWPMAVEPQTQVQSDPELELEDWDDTREVDISSDGSWHNLSYSTSRISGLSTIFFLKAGSAINIARFLVILFIATVLNSSKWSLSATMRMSTALSKLIWFLNTFKHFSWRVGNSNLEAATTISTNVSAENSTWKSLFNQDYLF